jgi:acetyl-CoA carboxylase biotin carboxyl carrier protein
MKLMANKTLDLELIRGLAKVLDETGLTEIEYAGETFSIRVNRQPAPQAATVALPAAVPPAPVAAASAVEAKPAKNAVTSPMVGTVYLAPEPGAAPFVRVGDRVAEGATLLIVEAMKVMNPIRAPRSGTISAIYVEDAQPVEFGEALVAID